MYTKDTVSPLDLYLDPKNPRFIIPEAGENQSDIRKYLITQEDILSLAKGISENNGLMPGERIVVCAEDGKYFVLEGNRRTSTCQMFLDRTLIPNGYESRFPATSDILKANIEKVEVDVIVSREEAKRFLAVRHIERAREWSTIAKMRFCYEDYSGGKSVRQINERTGITVSNINKYIRQYKILLRGLNSCWTEEEKRKLNLLDIKPDKLLRIFGLSDTTQMLKLYYDENFILRSNKINDSDLDEIIHIWTQKAFIDDEMDTRSVFGTYIKDGACTGACSFIKHILDRYSDSEQQATAASSTSQDETGDSSQQGGQQSQGGTGGSSQQGGQQTQGGTGSSSQQGGQQSQGGTGSSSPQGGRTSQGGGPSNLPFFSTINWSSVDPANNANKGIIAVCQEIIKISNSASFINNYPICTAFIIRSLIEQSLKYYARNKGYWSAIMRANNASGAPGGDPTLSFIIRQYNSNIGTWIPVTNIRRLFNIVFNNNVQTEKLNLVVHSPESYLLTPDALRAIPGEGLLEIVNFLLG